MARPNQKTLIIHRVPLVNFGAATSSPTLLYYQKEGAPIIGELALARAETNEDIPRVNHDFKVALGSTGTNGNTVTTHPCADGQERTAASLALDYIKQCLLRASETLKEAGVADSAHIIVAEPVSVHSEDLSEWLPAYRRSLRDLLENRRMEGLENLYFGEIEFLPEPLAVFNYYRYGYRHPELTGKEKYCVLVLDVGGGTSDCSVVETTKDGEVSQGGRLSKPLGSSSAAVAGYFVNHHLAARAFDNAATTPKQKRAYQDTLKKCLQVMHGQIPHNTLSKEDSLFFDNYQWVIHFVEKAKRQLSTTINRASRGWSSNVPPAAEEWIELPREPYAEDSEWDRVPISTSTFLEVFTGRVWDPHLKPLILRTIQNATPALEGKPINRVILSGGTANIGWISEWILRDIPSLCGAIMVDIKEDYQEVVAKGLAIECARRFFSEDHTSDFEMVTYNPLSLALGAGDDAPEPISLKPIGGSGLPDLHKEPGAMIEAATDMRRYNDTRLEWKVVSALPLPKHIEYYFHASAPDELKGNPSRTESRLNFDQWELTAPKGAKFDAQLKIALEIRADGTVTPTFIYREGKHATDNDICRTKPFFLDMTSSCIEKKTATKAYLGLDFGSSNTALAFVSAAAISQYQHDAEDPSWLELNELETHLPTPIALPLALYISESGDVLKRAKRARQFIETGLSLLLAAVVADEEKRARGSTHAGRHGPIKAFKQSKVSAGPIWKVLKDYITTLTTAASFTKPLAPLMEAPIRETMERAVTDVAQCKHDKADEAAIDWNKPLLQLGNIARQVFERAHFGFFQESRLRAGKVHAKFRRLNGQGVGSAPVSVVLSETPEDGQPYLFDLDASIAIPLFPWILLVDAEDSQRRKILLFDGPEGKDNLAFSYRCPGEPHSFMMNLGGSESLDIYAEMAAKLVEGRFPARFIEVIEPPVGE